jgi:muconate cycloisomerase
MLDIKIRAATIYRIATRIRMKRRHGIGDISDSVPGVILRLDTDAGLTGWGEAAPWSVFTGTAEGNAQALHRYFRPLLIGRNATEIESIMEACEEAVVYHTEAKAAIETALYDILGQALKVPVHVLLGGRYRDEIPLSFSIANPDLEADLVMARELYAQGLRIFKVKTGFASHDVDLKRLEKLRMTLPGDVDLRVDYNQGLEVWDAIPKLREIERFRPTFIEQPVPRDQIDAMAAITAAIDTPIMADESVFSPADALRVARARAADLFSIKIMKSGGFTRARKVSAIAEAAGIACYGGTMWEGGIALTAGSHLIAATPNISLGCEFYAAKYFLERDVLADPFPVKNGKVQIPTGPGLGIRINEDTLHALTVERLGD